MLENKHKHLLQAALLAGDAARSAWRQCKATFDLNSLDADSFAVLPQLGVNLRRQGVDTPVLARLEGVFRQTLARYAARTRTLIVLLKNASDSGIPVALGGLSALALTCRNCRTVIPTNFELLVRPYDLDKLDSILRQQGWTALRPLPAELLRPYIDSVLYRHTRDGDLHLRWRPFTIQATQQACEAFWLRTQSQVIAEQELIVPSTEDQLLMACLQATPVELALVINLSGEAVNWTVLEQLASQAGLAGLLATRLREIPGKLLRPVPDSVLNAPPEPWPFATEPATLKKIITELRWRYRNANKASFSQASIIGFTNFVLAWYQYHWQTKSLALLPFAAARRLSGKRLD